MKQFGTAARIVNAGRPTLTPPWKSYRRRPCCADFAVARSSLESANGSCPRPFAGDGGVFAVSVAKSIWRRYRDRPDRKTSMDRKKRILLVEDDSGSRKLMSIVLGRAGYDVVGATNGEEAVDQTNRPDSVDLIIMDLELPWLSGAAVIAKLKSNAATKHVPVIVTTSADRDAPIVQQAINAGAEKILYKPTAMNLLMETVSRYLSGG